MEWIETFLILGMALPFVWGSSLILCSLEIKLLKYLKDRIDRKQQLAQKDSDQSDATE